MLNYQLVNAGFLNHQQYSNPTFPYVRKKTNTTTQSSLGIVRVRQEHPLPLRTLQKLWEKKTNKQTNKQQPQRSGHSPDSGASDSRINSPNLSILGRVVSSSPLTPPLRWLGWILVDWFKCLIIRMEASMVFFVNGCFLTSNTHLASGP